jgi:hypothetical protein
LPLTITPTQRLLLRAAVDEPDRALRDFSDWWGRVDLSGTGSTEYRLLPLVYHNIGRQIPDAVAAARVKGAAKHVWLTNQLNAELATTVLDRLEAADIPTVMLKGSAMMVAVSESNMRLMGDCDILVEPNHAPRAFAALRGLGLTESRDLNRLTATDYKRIQGLPLVRRGALVDIHWRPLRSIEADRLTRDFFEQSEPCLFSNRPTRRPCFQHMLLHVIVHGAEWALIPRYDWMADATLILRKAGSNFDWEMFAEAANRYRLGTIARRALDELAQTLDIPVPANAFGLLAKGSFIDRAEARLRYTNPDRMSLAHRSITTLQAFRRQDHQLAGKSAWAIVPDIWRSVYGPPPRSLLQSAMADDAEDHVIYLAGWHEPERGGRWTSGSLAVLAIQRAPGRNGQFLRIIGYPMQTASNEPRVVSIYSGWRRLGRLTWDASSQKTHTHFIQLPPALSRQEVITLQFHIDRPVAPADVGQSADIRQLGLFLQDIRTLSPRMRDAATTPLKFNHGSGDLVLLWSGWSQPEAQGCWTDGPHASLRWVTPVDLSPGARLVIRGIVLASTGEALRGSISINGQQAGNFVQPEGQATLSVPVASQAQARQRDIHVQFEFENAKSPCEIGLSSDQRKLALFLTSISIET